MRFKRKQKKKRKSRIKDWRKAKEKGKFPIKDWKKAKGKYRKVLWTRKCLNNVQNCQKKKKTKKATKVV